MTPLSPSVAPPVVLPAVCTLMIGGYKLRIRYAPEAEIATIREHLPPTNVLAVLLVNEADPKAPGVFQVEIADLNPIPA